MLPILFVSRDRKQAENYIASVVAKQKIPSYYVFQILPETTVISIEQIRDLSAMTQRFKEQGLVAIFDFHTAKNETQNAFLKTLEEESDHIQFIVCVEDDGGILPTIRSRVQVVYGEKEAETTYGLLKKYGLLEADISHEKWLSISTRIAKEDAEGCMRELSDYMHGALEKEMVGSAPYRAVQQKLMDSLRAMKNNNVNFEYALDAVGATLAQNDLLPLPSMLL